MASWLDLPAAGRVYGQVFKDVALDGKWLQHNRRTSTGPSRPGATTSLVIPSAQKTKGITTRRFAVAVLRMEEATHKRS
jgi:hypothetical protein